MNTFLPDISFVISAKLLDNKRLWKQVVEADQLINCQPFLHTYITTKMEIDRGWVTHPACYIWYGYTDALRIYRNVMLNECKQRGIKTNKEYYGIDDAELPPWFFDDRINKFTECMRANLVRKDSNHYKFKEKPMFGYYWPRKLVSFEILEMGWYHIDISYNSKISKSYKWIKTNKGLK